MAQVTRTYLVLAVLGVALLSGCTLVSDGGDDEIVDRVERKINSTESLRATMIATTEVGNRTITERVKLRYERPQHYNLTWKRATNGTGDPIENATGDVVVANGSQLWAYDTASDRVTWLNETRPRTLTELLMPSRQFGRNVTVGGTETIAGTDAVKLSYAIDGSKLSLVVGDADRQSRLVSRMGESTPVNATVWVDRDRALPIRTELTVSAFEDPVKMTWRYEDIERNVEIQSGSFDPPADAMRATPWQDIEERLGEHQTVETMRTEANVSITEPTVPDGYTFQWGNVTTTNGTERVILFYRKDTAIIQLTRWDNASRQTLEGGESVSVGSNTGTLVTLGQRRLVEWNCGGDTYLLSTRVDRQTALDMAASVAC